MTDGHSASASSGRMVVLAISAGVTLYALACVAGLPQYGTQLVREAQSHANEDPGAAHDGADPDSGEASHGSDPHDSPAAEHADGTKHAPIEPPSFVWVLPFAALLLCIAVLPLIPATERWWESNLHRFYVAGGLGLVTLGYFLVAHEHAIDAHWPAHSVVVPNAGSTLQWGLAWTVLANAILHEYIPFIVLLFSLYTISGGIRIEGNLAARPLTNVTFIAVGGALASFIGTTGAAMLLIRPLLETNKERKHKVPTVIFFIFVVCNCGGCLLPIGDPPLFLGYLRGVDFLWTMNLWREWLFVNGLLLMTYWIWDHFFLFPHETIQDRAEDAQHTRRLQISGWALNVPLLVGIVVSVALLDPSKPVLQTGWHAPMYLREVVQIAMVGLSLALGSAIIRRKNHFDYHAIIEVAALFLGIFICMQPALQILNVVGGSMGVDSPVKFFWATGGLSAVLDNAPTYVVFFETARTLNEPGVVHAGTVVLADYLVGISLGAVFMGAMTYIGNGPNFMVKAIAETSGVRMPSFFGYMKYSLIILLPILGLTSWLFL